MSTRRSRTLGLILGCGVAACATSSPAPTGPPVIPVNGVPAGCANLGTVIGESEATGRGATEATPDQLASQAAGDAMGRAARLGATHIFFSPVTLKQKDGKPSGATLTGVAFRCGGGPG
jgi:hypothetical protein